MIKVISMWNYSSIVSRDAAEAHYHDVHIPLAMRLFNDLPGVLGYVQKRVGPSLTRDVVTGEPRGTPPPFEWLIELELRSLDTLGELSRHALIEDLAQDHHNFMDNAASRTNDLYIVEDNVLFRRGN